MSHSETNENEKMVARFVSDVNNEPNIDVSTEKAYVHYFATRKHCGRNLVGLYPNQETARAELRYNVALSALKPKNKQHQLLVTGFLTAVRTGNYEAVEKFLKFGIDPDSHDTNKTPALVLAARNKQTGIVKLLLDNAADIEAEDSHGNTAFTIAKRLRLDKMIEVLESHGASSSVGLRLH